MSSRDGTNELATVVVVPRERFSYAAASLKTLYDTLPSGVRVIYVDGGSPRRVARALREGLQKRDHELLRTEFFLSPQQARNLALPLVKTPYVVFVDNDVIFTPAWLERLVDCAEETGAWAVAPLYLEGPLEEQRIHMAGGDCWTFLRKGKPIFREEHTLMDRHLPDVRDQLTRRPTELLEGHTFCVRTDALHKIGPFDEGLLSADDHTDFSLMIGAAGGTIYFEPASIISYHPPPPFAWFDLPYYIMRWSDHWNQESFAHFSRKWRVSFGPAHGNWYIGQRTLYLAPVRTALERLPGKRLGDRIYRHPVSWLERALTRLVVWWKWDRPRDKREAHLKASPHSEWKALDRAQVEAYASKKFAPKPEGFRLEGSIDGS